MAKNARWIGALLLGGAVLFTVPGCKVARKMIPFWPDKADHSSEGVGDGESAPAATAAEPSQGGAPPVATTQPQPGFDPGTGRHAEPSGGGEAAPTTHSIPELEPVHFDFDSDALTSEALVVLARAAAHLEANPGLRVVIRGHTDGQGTDEYNVALGSNRAQAVREHLIGLGVAPDRLETISFGEFLPVVEETAEPDRAKNRRVDFLVFE